MTARIVVPESAPREVWLAERGEGVTASEVWEIARGGIKTWLRILEQKLNGSRFRGTAATSAGHEREAALLDELAAQHRLSTVTPNAALWAARGNDLHRATPDAMMTIATMSTPPTALVVVEVKSHEFGWKSDRIPPEHMGQLQWQMHVLGAASGLYGFEVRDEDDMPPLDGATWIRVERDEEMIAWLVERADAFLAWREAGCPDVDDLPADVAAALEAWAPAKAELDAAAADEKVANAAMKKALAVLPHAARFGAVGMGASGGFQLTVSESVSIDEDAWREGNPDGYRRVVEMRTALAMAEAAALRSFPTITRRTALRFQEVEDALSTYIYDSTTKVSAEVFAGRIAAHQKHGENSIEAIEASDPRWLSILVEEVGEAAHELTYDSTGSLREELIDIITVATAWVASIDRQTEGEPADV